MGDDWKVFEGDANPLYDAYIVDTNSPSDVKKVAEDAKKIEGVSEVQDGGANTQRLFELVSFIRVWGLIIAGLLQFGRQRIGRIDDEDTAAIKPVTILGRRAHLQAHIQPVGHARQPGQLVTGSNAATPSGALDQFAVRGSRPGIRGSARESGGATFRH